MPLLRQKGFDMNQLKFGWAEYDITPTEKIALQGEFFERVTNEVETPITVTAFAVESDGDQAVFCSCDLVEVNKDLLARTREKLAEMDVPGLDLSKIMLNAIHTHNSYTVGDRTPAEKGQLSFRDLIGKYMPEDCEYIPEDSDPNQMDPLDALEKISDKTAAAIAEAWNGRKAGMYANAFGRAAVGMNRRVCYSDGSTKMWGDADRATFTELEGGNDSGIEMIFTYDADRKLTGVVACIACPSQVMEQRTLISSDYWGKVKILLREKYGKDLFVLALCAPAGDQCPRDLIRWVEPETPIKDPNVIRIQPKYRRADPSMFDVKGTWVIGRRIVNEIEYALENVEELRTAAVLKHTAKTLNLPIRRVTDKDKADAEKAIREFFVGKTKVNYIDSAELHVHLGTLRRFDVQETENTVAVETHIIRLGDVVFATNPYELFLDYGNQIRSRSAAAQTFLIQLSCGAQGYLPTAKAEAGGHYSAYVASGECGHEGGDLYVRDTLREIDQLFDEK